MNTTGLESIFKDPPKSKADVRAILGSLQFLSKFVPQFSELTKPVVDLTCKGAEFVWTHEHAESLRFIEKALRNAQPAILPDKHSPKIVQLYTLPQSIDVVCEDRSGNLIDRASRLLSESERNYTKVERTLLALVLACAKFEHFLSQDFTVFTTECKDVIHALRMSNRPERVERLLLQIPSSMNPLIEMRGASKPEWSLQFDVEPPEATFYTDGASISNGKDTCKAGWVVYCLEQPELSASGEISLNPSNQTAELRAVIEACKIAKDNGFKHIAIVSDSRYVLNSVQVWIPKWLNNEFRNNRKKPVINQRLMLDLMKASENLNVKWCFAKAHGQDFGNSKADELAKSSITNDYHKLALAATFGPEQQLRDPEVRRIYEALSDEGGEQNDRYDRFTVENDLLYFKDPSEENPTDIRLMVPLDQRRLLLQLAHDDQLYGGHLGVRKTLKKLRSYWWEGMTKDAINHVRTCELCQKFKNPVGPKVGKLHPIPVSQLFERLHIDIIGLMHTQTPEGNQYIITAIDAYSRFAFARAYKDSKTNYCINSIIAIHGCPDTIVSDQGKQFTGNEWAEMMRKYGIKHHFTNPYHPQSNGMDERLNGTLIKILRSYCTNEPVTWDQKLQWALFNYNTSFHEALKMTPYEVVFGVKPRTPLNLQPRDPISQQEAREAIRSAVATNMEEARRAQKYFYDRRRKEAKYEVGDKILIRNHNLSRDQGRKLQEKWIGPAIIIKVHSNAESEQMYLQVINFAKKGATRVQKIAIKDVKPFYSREGFDLEASHITSEDARQDRSTPMNIRITSSLQSQIVTR